MPDVLEHSELEDDADEAVVEVEENVDADEYGIGIDIDNNSGRIQFYDENGVVLSRFVTDAPGLYDFAQRLLRAYDKLEGID